MLKGCCFGVLICLPLNGKSVDLKTTLYWSFAFVRGFTTQAPHEYLHKAAPEGRPASPWEGEVSERRGKYINFIFKRLNYCLELLISWAIFIDRNANKNNKRKHHFLFPTSGEWLAICVSWKWQPLTKGAKPNKDPQYSDQRRKNVDVFKCVCVFSG